MPDINLLKDTIESETEQTPPSPLSPDSLPVTDPRPIPKGLGVAFRNLFRKTPPPPPLEPTAPVATAAPAPKKRLGQMSVGRIDPTERILSEKRQSSSAVIPLPEQDAGYQVNLLSEDLSTKFHPREHLFKLGLSAAAGVLVVALAFVGLTIYENQAEKQVEVVQHDITQVKDQIARLTAEQSGVDLTLKKMAVVRELIEHHIHWTKFFDRLERYTLPTVKYGAAFSGTLNSAMVFTATTDSFEEVAKQYLILQQAVDRRDFISEFNISGASRKSGKEENSDIVSFSVTMMLLPEMFYDQGDLKLPGGQPAGDDLTNSNTNPQ